MKTALLALTTAVVFGSLPAAAQHLDVKISTSKGPVAGSKIQLDVYGDLSWYIANAGGMPLDFDTGYGVFPANFSDLKGGPYLTDNPGFQSFAGQFQPNEEVWFRAVGSLQYLAPGAGSWVAADPGGGIRLYGAIPDDIVFDFVYNGTRESEYNFYAGGTLFHGGGISGPTSAPIGLAGRTGSLHYHLNWGLEGTAQGRKGSFMLEMQVFSSATIAGGAAKYQISDPFFIIFRNDVTDDQFASAMRTLTQPPAPVVAPAPVPEPQTWAMLVIGLGLAGGMARRRREGSRSREGRMMGRTA